MLVTLTENILSKALVFKTNTKKTLYSKGQNNHREKKENRGKLIKSILIQVHDFC